MNKTAKRSLMVAAVAGLLVPSGVALAAPAGADAGRVSCEAMTQPIHQVVSPGSSLNLITASETEADAAAADSFTDDRGATFSVSPTPKASLVPVHRVGHPDTGDLDWVPVGPELTRALTAGYTDNDGTD